MLASNKATRVPRQAHKRSSIDLLNRLNLGISLQQNGDFEKASEIYKSITKSSPKNQHAWHMLGLIEFQKNNFLNSKILIEKSLNLDPFNSDFLYNYGLLLEEFEDLNQAKNAYEKCIEINASNYKAFNNLGVILKNNHLLS
jgi:tetratricopeptide (TPR) repeat protein